jgi:hypothetical protein
MLRATEVSLTSVGTRIKPGHAKFSNADVAPSKGGSVKLIASTIGLSGPPIAPSRRYGMGNLFIPEVCVGKLRVAVLRRFEERLRGRVAVRPLPVGH